MSISAVTAGASALMQQASIKAPVTAARAPDGDTPAVEAKESAVTKMAEKQNGGIPKAASTQPVSPATATASAPTTGVNTTA